MLRSQVDALWPSRSRDSDGIMGDRWHRLRRSDHNLGNAIDLTHDPGHGLDASRLAEGFRHQMSHYSGGRLTYIIWERRLASPRSGWAWREYRGENPHTTHVHLSLRADRRDDTRPWSF
jgi:hypothetical protein